MNRIEQFIDWLSDIPLLPLIVTEKSKHTSIRVIGVLVGFVWFMPALLLWIVVGGLLSIPAMILDAIRGPL